MRKKLEAKQAKEIRPSRVKGPLPVLALKHEDPKMNKNPEEDLKTDASKFLADHFQNLRNDKSSLYKLIQKHNNQSKLMGDTQRSKERFPVLQKKITLHEAKLGRITGSFIQDGRLDKKLNTASSFNYDVSLTGSHQHLPKTRPADASQSQKMLKLERGVRGRRSKLGSNPISMQPSIVTEDSRRTIEEEKQEKARHTHSVSNILERNNNSSIFKKLQLQAERDLKTCKLKLSKNVSPSIDGGLRVVNSYNVQKSQLEKHVMERKVEALKEEYNRIAEDVKKKMLELEECRRLDASMAKIRKKKENVEENEQRMKQLLKKQEALDEEKEELKKEKRRMELIMEICRLSMGENEKSRIGLEKLNRNYDMCIEEEARRIDVYEKEMLEMKEIVQQNKEEDDKRKTRMRVLMHDMSSLDDKHHALSSVCSRYDQQVLARSSRLDDVDVKDVLHADSVLEDDDGLKEDDGHKEVKDGVRDEERRRREMELEFMREEYMMLKKKMGGRSTKEMLEEVRRTGEEEKRLEALKTERDALAGRLEGLEERRRGVEEGRKRNEEKREAMETKKQKMKQQQLQEKQKMLDVLVKKNVQLARACEHGVDIFNKLNALTHMPGKPMSINSLYVQPKKMSGFLAAFLDGFKRKLGDHRWKSFMELNTDPLLIIDELQQQELKTKPMRRSSSMEHINTD